MEGKRIPGKLALSRETIRELTESDLEHAQGASIGCQTPVVLTLPLNDCVVVSALANVCQ